MPLLYKPQFKCPVSVCPMPCAPVVLGFPPGPYLMKHDTSTCKETPAEVFCFVCLKEKKKRKGRKIKEEKQRMTVGNWQHKETLSSLSWLIYWTETSEAQGTRGHRSTHRSSLSFSLHFLPFDIYIYLYLYIFFTSSGYHDSNCSHMNTGVISRA